MGVARDRVHKRRATGGKQTPWRKKRKFELARPPALTKIAPRRVHDVRVRGGHTKYRALRLESGGFSWGSEAISKKTRILVVSYNASNNEYVRTNTLVKNSIVQIDATPFKQWYEQHYGVTLGKKKSVKEGDAAPEETKKGKRAEKLHKERAAERSLDSALEDQFTTGRLYAAISSRPGQSGAANGYILEGQELQFYLRKMQKKKSKKDTK
ncbi:component of cytosolic 80S ribosome and 40S small subunit [Planoprotostelium fungivorum]|uniref:40S ribosomal protein S8 n=1 Tax=Planoprotostelium fungivorum TaxID=1890364 RepID=A0A2P6NNA7_9EUKA|nr:component of cytosolic 80S ribosome and 40S small subunit [Planoprotostelium fungivorum]